MNQHGKVNYIEFTARDMAATKAFFSEVFEWDFEDYGPEYTAFSNAGIDGGFYKSELTSNSDNGSMLVVFFSDALEQTLEKVEKAGGAIVKPIFSFPGGRRFHFTDPSGNEFAVWGE
jgi:predicted enzyme related to lactoylglutathione lyase